MSFHPFILSLSLFLSIFCSCSFSAFFSSTLFVAELIRKLHAERESKFHILLKISFDQFFSNQKLKRREMFSSPQHTDTHRNDDDDDASAFYAFITQNLHNITYELLILVHGVAYLIVRDKAIPKGKERKGKESGNVSNEKFLC